jgi:hypothetical protein
MKEKPRAEWFPIYVISISQFQRMYSKRKSDTTRNGTTWTA